MRLNPKAGARHLTLEHGAHRHSLGIAEAVARAAAHGPGVLPPGIAGAVLRLAFGRGAETRVDASPSGEEGGLCFERGLRLVQTPRPILRRKERQPRGAAGE